MNVRLLLTILILLMLGEMIFPAPTTALTHSGFLPRYETETRLSWGGSYHRLEGLTSSGPVRVHYLTLDPTRLRPAVVYSSSGIGTLSPLTEMVQAAGALAGINASFFDTTSRLPIGFLLKDGQVLNAPYSSRATLAVGFFGDLHFVNPRISLLLRTSHGSIPIDGINRPVYSNTLILYTPDYAGPRGSWSDARVIGIRRDQIIWIGSGQSASYADRDTYWLVATGNARSRVRELLPAERVQLDYTMNPELYLIRDALQAGPMLLRGGRIVLSQEGFQMGIIQKPAARSALARTYDGSLIVLIVTRGNGSVGMSLPQLAQYLQMLGAVDAMAFDGGSSSSLVFQDGLRLRSLGSTRPISVGLVFLRR